MFWAYFELHVKSMTHICETEIMHIILEQGGVKWDVCVWD